MGNYSFFSKSFGLKQHGEILQITVRISFHILLNVDDFKPLPFDHSFYRFFCEEINMFFHWLKRLFADMEIMPNQANLAEMGIKKQFQAFYERELVFLEKRILTWHLNVIEGVLVPDRLDLP